VTALRAAIQPYPLLLALGALDAAGYSVIVPVAPAIADQTGAGPTVIGLLVASFAAGMVAGFALAGWAVTQRGSRPLLVISLGLVALGTLGFALGDSLAIYFLSRFLMGLGSGGIWIGVTFDTLARWPGQEYLCMSRIFAAYSAGGLIGPALGALGGIHAPFLAYLALLLLAIPLVLLVAEPASQRSFRADKRVLHTRGFRLASAAILFAVLALGVFEGVLPLHFADQLNQAEIAAFYVVAAIIVAASAMLTGNRRPRPLVVASVVLATAGMALSGAAAQVPLWMLALVVTAIGIGIGNTGSIGVLVQTVPVERIVTAMVIWSQIGIAGYLLGPLLGGITAERLGFAYLGLVPALAGTVVLALIVTSRGAMRHPSAAE
jgi:MFS family permease